MGCHMLKMRRLLHAFLILFPLSATAGWQVAQPQATSSREPFFQAGPQGVPYARHKAYAANAPRPFARPGFTNQVPSLGQPIPVYAVSISGSVKENLERIMGRYHWKVVWKAPYDYNFDGRVTGTSLPNVVEKLLQPFPLQAVMYMANRTMAVVPRTNKQ